MVFLAHALPDSWVDLWEEGISILPTMVDMSDIEFVHQWQELAIDHTSTDDKCLFVGRYSCLCLGDRVHDFGVVKGEILTVGQHNIAAIRQRVLG